MGTITEDLKNNLGLPNQRGAHVQQVYDAFTAQAAGTLVDDVRVKLGESSVAFLSSATNRLVIVSCYLRRSNPLDNK